MERAAGHPATPSEQEMFAFIEQHLYTAVIADSLDNLGFREQAMRETLRPVYSTACCAGWARTMECTDVHYTCDDPYEVELEAVDSLLPGEVAVVSTSESKRNAPWGELLSTASKARGARGAIIDGLVRDVRKIEELSFPVFAAGMKPVDSKGRGIMLDYNVPVECGGVLVRPGDLVVADFDGVMVIPSEAVAETLRLATDKVTRENHTRAELLQGAYLRDVYAKYGVL
jgi:4-hydroxy-4-methyl-2-oxoglutarate aldolase